MSPSTLNQALAENLAFLMQKKGLRQMALAKRCGVAQTSISNYLHPERRKLGKDGKPGSAKLTEVEMLAEALGVEPWELLRPMNGPRREVYERIEAAYKALTSKEDSNFKGASPAAQKLGERTGAHEVDS
ncbi:helix-turn-helix domain-containing protein [Comamonas terrigena]|uniref:helix-turn-helix domain-containing protein n=1 Tax=Comamonas terrigena TaxID=32013 RepID=UPI0028970182|nr:helix-turn-helix transcriptional regulator [Comamonas terrigena]